VDPTIVLILEGTLLILTAAAAVAALVQAQAAVQARRDAQKAQAESEHARDEAAALAREAIDESKRQTDALQRRNELAERALPKDEVRWVVRHLNKSRWEIVNAGSVDIPSARVVGAGVGPGLIRPDEKAPRPVPRGDGLAFIAFQVSGPDPVMRIEFYNPITGEDEHLDRAIR
jgi:hypothetical protein